jgi:eukaryotic-like serine/threonine-protein kinase
MRCPACSFDNAPHAVACQRCLTPLRDHGAGAGAGAGAIAPSPAPQTVPEGPSLDVMGGPAGRLVPGVMVDKKYLIERVIGEGGMGVVYLAHDRHTDQKVVVKALHDSLAADPTNRERVRSEGKALARIDHPNVVRLNAVVDDGLTLLLIMQYVEGKSLDKLIEERIAERKPMPLSEITSLFRQTVMGVAAAHHEGLVHRDLKPANVLLRTKDGVAKVTDFGIAKTEDDAKAGRGKTQGIIGSLWYMSPEQVTGQRDLDKRVDIYALGIVLFELCCGKVPFDADSDYAIMRMHIDVQVPSIVRRRPDLPATLDAVIAKAAAKNRDDRYPNCEALLAAFDAAVAPAQTSAFARPSYSSLPHIPQVVLPQGPGGTAPLAAPTPEPSYEAQGIPSARGSATTGAPVMHDRGADPRASQPSFSNEGGGGPSYPDAYSDDAAVAKAGSSRGRVLAVAGVLVALGLGAGLVAHFLPDDGSADGRRRHRGADGAASASTSTSASSAATPAPPENPLEALQGKWVSDSGKHYDAVLAGDTLEFRVQNAKEYEAENYVEGETRFGLRHDGSVLTVEDKLRPLPPSNATYSPESRPTCQEVWTSVGGQPLRAQGDKDRLSVDLVKFVGETRFFAVSRGMVRSCSDFKAAKVERIESLLTRQKE